MADPSKITLIDKFQNMMTETFYGNKKKRKKRKKSKAGQVDHNIQPGIRARTRALKDVDKY